MRKTKITDIKTLRKADANTDHCLLATIVKIDNLGKKDQKPKKNKTTRRNGTASMSFNFLSVFCIASDISASVKGKSFPGGSYDCRLVAS